MKVKELTDRNIVDQFSHVRIDMFKNIGEMDVLVLKALNDLAKEAEARYNWLHVINSDYRPNDDGQHGIGNAIDFVFFKKKPGDVPVIDQFIFVVGFGAFRRVGLYPHWNAPGLHGDIKDETLYWWQDKTGKYLYGYSPAEIITWRVPA